MARCSLLSRLCRRRPPDRGGSLAGHCPGWHLLKCWCFASSLAAANRYESSRIPPLPLSPTHLLSMVCPRFSQLFTHNYLSLVCGDGYCLSALFLSYCRGESVRRGAYHRCVLVLMRRLLQRCENDGFRARPPLFPRGVTLVSRSANQPSTPWHFVPPQPV